MLAIEQKLDEPADPGISRQSELSAVLEKLVLPAGRTRSIVALPESPPAGHRTVLLWSKPLGQRALRGLGMDVWHMGPQDMPVESTPKEVDPDDVALAPEDQICEEIYQRVLSAVRAHLDQRIAVIEAQAAGSEPVEGGEPAAHGSGHAGAYRATRRRPLLRLAIGIVASAGLVGAVATLTRGTSATNWMQDAVQSIRQNLLRVASIGESDAAARSHAADVTSADPALVAPAAAPSTPPIPASPASVSADSAALRDLAPVIEKIAQVVGELQIGLQDLKARQEQASRDHARAIAQLQASQDQLTRAARAGATADRLAPRPRPPRFPYP